VWRAASHEIEISAKLRKKPSRWAGASHSIDELGMDAKAVVARN